MSCTLLRLWGSCFLCLCRASASFRGDLSGFVFSSATFRDVKAKGFADVFLDTDKRSDELGPAIMLYAADRPHLVKDILG